MQLTILNVAYPFAPVGPDAVGGAEQVLASLDAAIVEAGHRSIVVACEQSRTRGELVVSGPCHEAWSAELCAAGRTAHKARIQEALARWPVDVVHMHGLDFYEYLPDTDLPVLVTLHLPPSFYPDHVFHDLPPNVRLQCVSRSQAGSCPPGTELFGIIENGVALEELGEHRHARRRFALCVGRICQEKGYHFAIEAARQAGVPLFIGGAALGHEAHLRYLRDEFLPRLDRSHRWLGPLGLERKRRMLSAARCVLVPSVVAETSSLIAMEALACGTPVIAFPNGALADIVEHGQTGFLVHDTGEMAEAILQAHTIDAEACRRAARERFSAGRMTRRYLALYDELARCKAPCEPLEAPCVA